MENFRKNLLPEPEITDSAADSLRIQFRLPVAAEHGKAPGKLIRKFPKRKILTKKTYLKRIFRPKFSY